MARSNTVRMVLRVILALLYAAAGVIHLRSPAPFLRIMPTWVPEPELVITLTGIAELAGAIGLLQPVSAGLRRAAGWGLAAYAVCVFPANINHFAMDMARPDHGWGLGYHVPRMFAQPVIAWLALYVADVIDWPFRRNAPTS